MSEKSTKVYFVTWPDGKVMEGTQTSVKEGFAKAKAIMHFLPERWFPSVKVEPFYGAGEELWRAMTQAGFRCQSVDIPADGVSY